MSTWKYWHNFVDVTHFCHRNCMRYDEITKLSRDKQFDIMKWRRYCEIILREFAGSIRISVADIRFHSNVLETLASGGVKKRWWRRENHRLHNLCENAPTMVASWKCNVSHENATTMVPSSQVIATLPSSLRYRDVTIDIATIVANVIVTLPSLLHYRDITIVITWSRRYHHHCYRHYWFALFNIQKLII